MDGTRFDDLTAKLAASRRTILRTAGIGALGAVLARLGLEDAAAACKAPGKGCKQGDKCCGGAKCRKDKCRCPKGRAECGKDCCQPGQVCQDGAPKVCVNGPLAPGDACSPKKELACASGNCECITNTEDVTVCTCRQDNCLGFGADCTNTSQCCAGGCDGFSDTCEPDV
jgi:hypothetical protein